MEKNGRGVVLVHRCIFGQLLGVSGSHALVEIFGIVEAVCGKHPSLVRFFGKTVEVRSAGHAVLEMAVAKSSRKIQLSIDAVLVCLFEDDSSSVYNLH